MDRRELGPLSPRALTTVAWYEDEQRGSHASGRAEGAECLGDCTTCSGNVYEWVAGLVRRLSWRIRDGPPRGHVREDRAE